MNAFAVTGLQQERIITNATFLMGLKNFTTQQIKESYFYLAQHENCFIMQTALNTHCASPQTSWNSLRTEATSPVRAASASRVLSYTRLVLALSAE